MEQTAAAAERWGQQMEEQAASGLSVAEYCRQAGLNRKQFFRWRRKLQQAARPEPGAAAARRRRGQEARQYWAQLIDEQQRSGQSVAAWCRERGLWAPSLFAWKRRLAEAAEEAAAEEARGPAAGFVEVRVRSAGAEPARRAGAAAGAPIEVRLGNGRGLLVGPGFDPGHLRALLAVLEAER